jgi:hypothetical protein
MLTIELGMGQANQRLLPSFVYPQRHIRIEIPFGNNQWIGARGKRSCSVLQSNGSCLLAERVVDSDRGPD